MDELLRCNDAFLEPHARLLTYRWHIDMLRVTAVSRSRIIPSRLYSRRIDLLEICPHLSSLGETAQCEGIVVQFYW